MNEVRNILVGLDLTEKGSQLSYFDRRTGEPVSTPVKVGTNLYVYPLSVCKMEGRKEWHTGIEADYFGTQSGGILMTDLYEFFCGTEKRRIDGRDYEPSDVLAIYLRDMLNLMGVPDIIQAIDQLTITAETLSKPLVDNIKEAAKKIGIPPEELAIRDHLESFYYYAYSQKEDLRARDVGLFAFEDSGVTFRSLSMDHLTRPALVRPQETFRTDLPDIQEERDIAFLRFAEQHLEKKLYSAIYITGTGFDTAWAKRSVPYLCKGKRHVFQGQNLFVRGACYSSIDRETHALKGTLYLGEDLIRTNLGIEMVVRGNPSYFPLISAGTNWFEAGKSCEFILDDKDHLAFSINTMDGRTRKYFRMDLNGLPERPPRATRLHLTAECLTRDLCRVTVRDLGFGGFYESSGKVWEDTLPL